MTDDTLEEEAPLVPETPVDKTGEVDEMAKRKAALAAELKALEAEMNVRDNFHFYALADALHSVFCHPDHDSGACTYVAEQNEFINDESARWNQPAHAKMLAKATELASDPLLLDPDTMTVMNADDLVRG